MVSNEILSQAAGAFGFDMHSLEFVSNSTNEVYKYIKGNKSYFLRLSEKPVEYEMMIQSEVHWVRYLAENGVRASLPIQTLEGSLTTSCRDHEKCFIAVVFEGAFGKFFNESPKLWGPHLFYRWGSTMGLMHRLTRSYDPGEPELKRMEWRPAEINNPHLHKGNYSLLLGKLLSIEKQLASLSKNNDSYGLIHNDFHPYNFLIHQGDITVFDFDDSLHGWFALDIGIAAAHAVWWGSHYQEWGSKNDFAKHFLSSFLEGYLKNNNLDYEWIRRIPLFMEYRNISSFFLWLGHWDGNEDNLSIFQKNAITEAVKFIERDMPFEGCNIEL
ncbi:phosphotransferase [Paenibacillus sp. FSL W8-0919]|uniref:phosphotransferase enzyme family protein n=1 Tax=Paenibacillus sp. FSL W8-0919 TaxID=2954707 RepID=UPI0030FB8731